MHSIVEAVFWGTRKVVDKNSFVVGELADEAVDRAVCGVGKVVWKVFCGHGRGQGLWLHGILWTKLVDNADDVPLCVVVNVHGNEYRKQVDRVKTCRQKWFCLEK